MISLLFNICIPHVWCSCSRHGIFCLCNSHSFYCPDSSNCFRGVRELGTGSCHFSTCVHIQACPWRFILTARAPAPADAAVPVSSDPRVDLRLALATETEEESEQVKTKQSTISIVKLWQSFALSLCKELKLQFFFPMETFNSVNNFPRNKKCCVWKSIFPIRKQSNLKNNFSQLRYDTNGILQ